MAEFIPMKTTRKKRFQFIPIISIVALFSCLGMSQTQGGGSGSRRPVGPGNIFVHPALAGTIFGFDIDHNGTEGLLSESGLGNDCVYATETFDQPTGKIIKVVHKGQSADCTDDEVTWGITGPSVGLVEHEHSPTFDHLHMSFYLLDPIEGNQITGPWLPPGKGTAYIWGNSRNQSSPVNAYQVYDVDTANLYVYGSNVGGDKFGPVTELASTPGIIGINHTTNTAVLTVGDGDPFGPSYITQLDLATGQTTQFLGIGSGIVQGLAVDSADNMAVTTTFGDAGVEFYDLTNQTGFEVILPGIPQNCNNACAGVDVEFDPIHKVFLVAQPISSQDVNSTTSAIYVYDRQGTLLETLNGFNFYTERFDVFPVHMALHPSDRSGFVDVTNSTGVGAIQSFTY
jgi:hypothetical protein